MTLYDWEHIVVSVAKCSKYSAICDTDAGHDWPNCLHFENCYITL